MEKEILDCPFCGKRPNTRVAFKVFVIECDNRKCLIAPSTWLRIQKTDITKVIKEWNKRAKPVETNKP